MSLTRISTRFKNLMGSNERPKYPLKQRELFPQDLIVHFSYHKCLTYYYQKIMAALQQEFGFYFHAWNSKIEQFNDEAIHRTGKRLLSVNHHGIVPWEQMPPYKGSHFIRDPRDLILSGYHYHLWTKEEWCRKPSYPWAYIIAMPEFKYVTTDPNKFPREESYQEYLNSLEPEAGKILELLWRTFSFQEMRAWNYHNPLILEMRYEDVIGHESESFDSLFNHYGFHPRMRERGLEMVEEFSLKNQRRGEREHLRSGESQQWEREFTPLLKQVFIEKYGDLLIHLGYASDMNWQGSEFP